MTRRSQHSVAPSLKQHTHHHVTVDWHQSDEKLHHGVRLCVRDLNRLHRTVPALYARDCESDGFRWISADDRDQSVTSWLRFADDGRPVAVISNFTPVPRQGYRIGLPMTGFWREILNTDSAEYGGSGLGNLGGVVALPGGAHGFEASADILVPPLATVFLWFEGK